MSWEEFIQSLKNNNILYTYRENPKFDVFCITINIETYRFHFYKDYRITDNQDNIIYKVNYTKMLELILTLKKLEIDEENN